MKDDLEFLVGKVIKDIKGLEKWSEEVEINTEDGHSYVFYHEQNCCENVSLEDFDGDKQDLFGGIVISAEKVSGSEPENYTKYEDEDNEWTFYKIETTKGGLWMRWFGSSNGYYGTSVHCWMKSALDNEPTL